VGYNDWHEQNFCLANRRALQREARVPSQTQIVLVVLPRIEADTFRNVHAAAMKWRGALWHHLAIWPGVTGDPQSPQGGHEAAVGCLP
jgi:hypothetical protein